MSPVLAGLAVAIGVPILLFYVYGVVPVSLVRIQTTFFYHKLSYTPIKLQ